MFSSQKRGLTPISFVLAILRAYEKYGCSPTRALQAAQIPPELLQCPSARITARQFESLSGFAMRELDDEALGWFSRRLPWGTYAMLCRASLTADTLGLAMARWCRHHRLLTEDIALSLCVTGQTASLSIEEKADLGVFRELCLVTLFRYLLGFSCWAINSKIALASARFAFAAPADAEVYPVIFSPAIAFDANENRIAFDARYLALPLKRGEADLNRMIKRALPLTISPYRSDRQLANRVEQILRRAGAEFGAADSLASELNISTRSLHRHLQAEQTSLRELKEKVRRDIVLEALARTRKPIKSVARAAGFINEKSFSRAFRKWTGQSPSAYRNRSTGFDP